MVQIKTNLSNKNNYGSTRTTNSIKYIVIHYTANDGDHDESNGNYFHNNVVGASAHYFVDSDSITQSVPDNYVAWSVGGNKYNNNGGSYYGKCTNNNSISIELCDDVKNGVYYPSQATIKNALDLVNTLMNKYSIPKSNVIRHYDVTGKACPAYWCGNAEKDNLWKTAFWNKIGSTNAVETKSDLSYKVKITASVLNVRNGVGVTYPVVTFVNKGEVYTIVAEQKGWGKLKSGVGWINLSYTSKV